MTGFFLAADVHTIAREINTIATEIDTIATGVNIIDKRVKHLPFPVRWLSLAYIKRHKHFIEYVI